jgi:epoxyqueuosine reductase QueG
MGLEKETEEMATQLGADIFGVASADAFDDAPSGHHPKDVLPNAKSVIVIGMKMLDAQTDILPVEGEHLTASSRQEMFRGHNAFISQDLDRIGYSIARFLEKKGFKAYHQMASTGGTDPRYLMGLLSLKHMAVQAGLGVLGYNSLLITQQFGPRLRLAAIVTNAEMKPHTPINKNFCQTCQNPCISLCPANALKKPSRESHYELNKFACSQYLSTRPTCSICLKMCPIGSQRIK